MMAAASYAAELTVSDGHVPYAPMDIRQKGASPSASLSRAERKELVQEFRGLLSLGTRNHSFESWSGKSMADCYEPDNAGDRWKHKCEIITGQGNGFYYFYEDSSRRAATLQRVDVVLQTSDEHLLKELRPTLLQIFGRREMMVNARPGLKTVGPIRHWNTGQDIADLYLDATTSLNGTVRFVWTRAPLTATRQAQLPKTGN